MKKRTTVLLFFTSFFFLSLCIPAMADDADVRREIIRQESMKEEIYREMREHLSEPCARKYLLASILCLPATAATENEIKNEISAEVIVPCAEAFVEGKDVTLPAVKGQPLEARKHGGGEKWRNYIKERMIDMIKRKIYEERRFH